MTNSTKNTSRRSCAQRRRRERESTSQPQPPRRGRPRKHQLADNAFTAGEAFRHEHRARQREQRQLHAEMEDLTHDDHTERNDVAENYIPLSAIPPGRRRYVDPLLRHDCGVMHYECRFCHSLHWLDEKLESSSRQNPEFTKCCMHGQINLPPFQLPPEPLLHLYTSSDAQSINFRQNIWEYNRALAFTSLGAKIDYSILDGHGPAMFRIQGELAHNVGAFLPNTNDAPRYAQLYIYDSREALRHRMANNREHDVRQDTMSALQNMLQEHHQYTATFKHAWEILQAYPDSPNISVRMHLLPGTDHRRYNLPSADEIAVIIPSDQTSQSGTRDIILRKRGGGIKRINECNTAYVPLQYPLFFPYGEDGWYPELQRQNASHRHRKTRVTMSEYVSYLLHERPGQFSCLLRGQNLFQRYLVDMCAANEQNRLEYLRQNQHLFRSTVYQGLEDAVNANQGEIDLNELGQRVILPSSHCGGPRYLQQRFQDSMAIARFFKAVDLFITMTTNPNWPEIRRELLPGQQPSDRPDLIARVFQMKKQKLISLLLDGALGPVCSYIYSVEFQKRGLPHMHLLLFFESDYKIRSPADIDSLISAKWPDPKKDPLLFETVKSCMVHGPCTKERCLDANGKCSKGFPRPFCESTTINEDGFPQYCRPNDGRKYRVNNRDIDNRWIVPYCPYLSALLDCHICVECGISLHAFKYLFKYISKGGDKASITLHKNDEIKTFIDGHYISAAQAAYSLMHNEMHGQNPCVMRLAVHLEGQHMVYFDPHQNARVVVREGAEEQTTLTAFFRANQDTGELGQIARSLTYQEFPQKLVWDYHMKEWRVRRQGFAIGRMYFVAPIAGERFYLRLLLTTVKGARSYKDLRTYGHSDPWPTFREACIARGLLEDDGEWKQCLAEASVMQTGHSLRQLFSTLLLFCNPTRPEELWREYRDHICDDLRWQLQARGIQHPTVDDVFDYGLYLLDGILSESNHRLCEWSTMPQPSDRWFATFANPLISEQLCYNHEEERALMEQREHTLNAEQFNAYNTILHSLNDDHASHQFFLSGAAGTGKTYIYQTLCNNLRAQGKIVLAVASSGIAAVIIPGGRTAHSTFKIPIDLHDTSVCSISKRSQLADLCRKTDLIIWDEISMQHRYAPEAVDRTLQDIRNNNQPFGNIPIVFGGDFRQILPVVAYGSKEDICDATLQHSRLWSNMNILHLTTNMRLGMNSTDRSYAEWLEKIAKGENSSDDAKIDLPPDMVLRQVEELIQFVYGDMSISPPPPPEYFLNRLLLAPRNAEVAEMNHEILSRMHGDVHIMYSADTLIHEQGADCEETNTLPPEFLRAINTSNLPPGELELKEGCPLILLRNLAPRRGLCNGTRLLLTQIQTRVLECIIIGGEHAGDIVLIPRISLDSDSCPQFTFNFTRRQFPVRLAFALSINKSQGQSAKRVGLDLRSPVFTHGQLYVALSRVTSRNRIKVLLRQNEIDNKVLNVVYNEILLN